MRTLVTSVLLMFCTPLFASEDFAACAKIESAVERLDCYDRLAGEQSSADESEQASEPPEAQAADGADTAADKADSGNDGLDSDTKPESIPIEQKTPAVADDETEDEREPESPLASDDTDGADADVDAEDESFGMTLFGKPREDPDRGMSIRSTIESVRESAAGNRVMTLANGQIWMEREPGRRSIDASQEVVILKRRWDYSMLLIDQNRRMTVQRID